MKGYSQSTLDSAKIPVPANLRLMYERVWDEADYIVPPAENGAFFVTTNVVITPNQTLGHCPEVIENIQWVLAMICLDLSNGQGHCSQFSQFAGPWRGTVVNL